MVMWSGFISVVPGAVIRSRGIRTIGWVCDGSERFQDVFGVTVPQVHYRIILR